MREAGRGTHTAVIDVALQIGLRNALVLHDADLFQPRRNLGCGLEPSVIVASLGLEKLTMGVTFTNY